MSIKDILVDRQFLSRVVVPREIDILLSSLKPAGDMQDSGGIILGNVELDGTASKSPIPGFDFALALPTDIVDPAPFKLKLGSDDDPTSFKFWVALSKQGQAFLAFKFLEGVPGLALTGAKITPTEDGAVLEAIPNLAPMLVSRSAEPGSDLGPSLLIQGSATEAAHARITPDWDSTEGIVSFGLEPPAVVFGSTAIGFYCDAITFDDSEKASSPGQGVPGMTPSVNDFKPDKPEWRGLLSRKMDFYLPASVPFFGGHPIHGYFAISSGDAGIELVVENDVKEQLAGPNQPAHPGYSIRIECRDPTARGLSALVPTLIQARMVWPLDGKQADVPAQGALTIASDGPLTLTATFARDPVNAPHDFQITLAASSQSPNGLLSVKAENNLPPHLFNVAVAFATSLIADGNLGGSGAVGDHPGVLLATLAAAGTALSALFEKNSQFVLHAVEITSVGQGLPVGGKISLTLDYSVAVTVVKIEIPSAISVAMRKNQPMRIRVRKVEMSINPAETGLKMIGLDFDRAEMEIENPGAWDVGGLQQIFDVLGSRSGRGSCWVEVDLRFKLNLGPISVSGLTIRATLNGPTPEVTIRGLQADLSVPGAIKGQGSLNLIQGGFDAYLSASIIPLKVAADAELISSGSMLVLRLGVDLPAPIPLANSGLGLFGIEGLVGFNGVPNYNGGINDPVLQQLKWEPKGVDSFVERPSQSTFGFGAVIGTLPDFGFSFSSKASVILTVPDIALRAALNGRVMQPVTKITDPTYPAQPGLSFLGFVGVDSEALSFAVVGKLDLSPLVQINIPLTGRFPFKETDDWYTYFGADGFSGQGRAIGPISAKVLPDILGIEADAYLMFRGRGISSWPYGRPLPGPPLSIADGFVVAFGFALHSQFGLRPIAWAELYASLDLLIGAKPPTLSGFGRAGGGLHLGPFSIGVQAQVSFYAQGPEKYFWAEVTGRIELLFFDIEGKVTISFGTKDTPTLPAPNRHPLDRLDNNNAIVGSSATLTDDSYRIVAPLVENPSQITDEMRVWPDAMISLSFSGPPVIAPGAGSQFPGVLGSGALPPRRIGSEMLFYNWQLDNLNLVDVTDEEDKFNGAGQAPNGQLSSRWQIPRSGSDDIRELILFSNASDLWVNRRSDGGQELPGKPLNKAANVCTIEVSAEPGWAVGAGTKQATPGFELPPDVISTNPLVSRVDAYVHHYAMISRTNTPRLDVINILPFGYSLRPARVIRWRKPDSFEREFSGHFEFPTLAFLQYADPVEYSGRDGWLGQQIGLNLVDPITKGCLLLVGDERLFDSDELFRGVIVEGDKRSWKRERYQIAGLPAALFYQDPDEKDAVQHITISYPLSAQLGVVGLRGITEDARIIAEAESNAYRQTVSVLSNAKAAGIKQDPAVNNSSERVILAPGRLYRLDVNMSWSGTISRQDEKGAVVPVSSQPPTSTYQPPGGDRSTNRQLFFRTAPVPTGTRYVAGHANYGRWLHRRRDVFEPEMIERYLSGYEPAQSETFRFCDDPLRAHFQQGHVNALAKAYKFTLSVAIRAIDKAGDEHAKPTLILPTWTFGIERDFLLPVDRIRFDEALTSPCDMPLPGATGSVKYPLEPRSWYEVYVLAKADEHSGFADGRLNGVTFRTSRWRTPEAMFRGLGFNIGSAVHDSLLTGDLAIQLDSLPAHAVVDGNDQAFDAALEGLGLAGWPVVTEPRLSHLWWQSDTTDWLYAGVLIESDEPIQRSNRITIDPDGPGLRTGLSTPHRFEFRFRDRSGCRLLYFTGMPQSISTLTEIVPTSSFPFFDTPAALLELKMDKLGDDAGSFTGSIVIPGHPAFSEDP